MLIKADAVQPYCRQLALSTTVQTLGELAKTQHIVGQRGEEVV